MPRTGVVIPQYHFDSKHELVEFGTQADELGYDSLWLGESWGREAVAALSYLAAETDQVELGPAIINVFSRTPTAIAMAAATMDELSEGRLNLGIGPSNPKIIEDWHGLDFERPLAREAEVIRVLDRVLSGQTVEYDGELHSLSDFALRAPVERTHIPAYVAALGPKNRRLTGELADGWMPHNIPFDSLQEAFELVAEGAKKADRDPDDIDVAPYVPTVVAEDVEYARDRIADHLAYYLGTSDLYNAAPTHYGFEEEARQIREHWVDDERAEASDAVTDEMVDVMGLATTPNRAREDLAALADYEMDHVIVKFPDRLDMEYIDLALEALAPN